MTSQIGGALPIEFGPITTQNVGVLRVLNQVIFPVRYTDSFYTDIVSTPRELSKFGIVLAHCERTHMDHIYLHVQTSNTDAIRFYTTHGFRITQTIYNYYRNISPPDCYILARSF
ncbi:hypothetical protein B5M09_001016, partial [Aphanomyces astaci]